MNRAVVARNEKRYKSRSLAAISSYTLSNYSYQPLILLVSYSIVEFIVVDGVVFFCQLAIQEREAAVLAFGRSAAFNDVAFEAVLPGISTFITELSSHTFTSSLQKVVLV